MQCHEVSSNRSSSDEVKTHPSRRLLEYGRYDKQAATGIGVVTVLLGSKRNWEINVSATCL